MTGATDSSGAALAAGARADQTLIGKRVITDNWLRNWEDPLNRETTGYYGSEADGGYAEYAVIDHRNARPVTSDLSDAELATFSCSYSTAEGMLWRANVGAGDRVLITGASGGRWLRFGPARQAARGHGDRPFQPVKT